MCLAVPSKIIEIDGPMATVDVMGLKKTGQFNVAS